jgi:hypothetical protein
MSEVTWYNFSAEFLEGTASGRTSGMEPRVYYSSFGIEPFPLFVWPPSMQ